MVQDWVAAGAGFGDDALRGCSALRAAALRAFGDESVTALGSLLVSVSVLWDIQGFYDTIQPARLLRDALGRSFPPQVLLLETLIHLAPRVLRGRQKECTVALYPERSILAGVRGAVDTARCYLFTVLDQAHREFFPVGVHAQLGR